MYVDNNGIVRFENLDDITPLQTNLNTALESVSNAITGINEQFADTGWVNLSYASGITAGEPGQLQVRRIGRKVEFQGGATRSGGFARNSYTDILAAALPTEFRPPSLKYMTIAGSAGRAGTCQILAGGIIRFNHFWDTNPGWFSLDGTTYLV